MFKDDLFRYESHAADSLQTFWYLDFDLWTGGDFMLVGLHSVLSFRPQLAHARALVSTAYFPPKRLYINGAADTLLAFICDIRTQLFSKLSFLDCSNFTNMLASSLLTTAYRFVHDLSLRLLTSSTATTIQGPDCERFICGGLFKSRLHPCAECTN